MKKLIAILLSLWLLLIMSACSLKQSAKQNTEHQTSFSISAETQAGTTAKTEVQTDSITLEKEETTFEQLTESEDKTNSQAEPTREPEASSESFTEQQEQSKEEEPMKEAQFYITAKSTTFRANFADNGSADAFRELLREGDLTINMSDYGNFEKVGSIGTSLPRKDKQISTTTGDVVLYQGNQIVIFYGTNSWSYSRLGKIEGATSKSLLSAFGNGDATITFSLARS